VTIALTLTRLVPGGPWMFVTPDGAAESVVVRQTLADTRDGARLTVFDLDDHEQFHVEAYAAVDKGGWGVFEPDGRALATYVDDGEEMVLREAASAPVATLRPIAGRWEIVELGGASLGFCWREAQLFADVIDERYGLVVFDRPSLLDPRALVAAPLVCWLRHYRGARPRPARSAQGFASHPAPEGFQRGPGEIGRALEVVLRMSE
jgi:hypothetical protein